MTKKTRLRKLVSHYGPNTSTALGIVALNDPQPFGAYWPMRFTQIIGGKRWSISLCVFRSEKPLRQSDVDPKTFLAANEL